jgi:hypothetical protein
MLIQAMIFMALVLFFDRKYRHAKRVVNLIKLIQSKYGTLSRYWQQLQNSPLLKQEHLQKQVPCVYIRLVASKT